MFKHPSHAWNVPTIATLKSLVCYPTIQAGHVAHVLFTRVGHVVLESGDLTRPAIPSYAQRSYSRG